MPRGQRLQVPGDLTDTLRDAMASDDVEGLTDDTREMISSILANDTDKLNPAQLQKILGQLLAAQNAEEAKKKDAPKKKRERLVLGPKPLEAKHTWIPDHVLVHAGIPRPSKDQTFEEQSMLKNPTYIKHSRRANAAFDSSPGWNRRKDVLSRGGR